MPFVFERGEEVHTGSPVENEFVFASDELVSDNDVSDFAFIRDRGLGAPSNIIHFDYHSGGSVSYWQDWHDDLQERLGLETDLYFSDSWSLDDAIEEDAYGLAVISMSSTTTAPTSAEEDAFAEFWEANGRAIIFAEDESSSHGDRLVWANDLIEAATGSRPFDGVTDEDNRCYTDPFVPTDLHPVFADVVEIGRRNDEAIVPPSPDGEFEAVYDHSANVWGYYDESDGRMWLDGGVHTLDNNSEPDYHDCLDNDRYGTRLIEWVLGDL